ncbi:conserved hypothetical protein [Histoplasma capsulatum var. duboisii H88]|uniref:Altered inheritance of mitochondria protein 9, mitochondrial n=1 Tax=Ajellomyces capsulatus (strain H88) TaxID=544711 RepID=F0UIR2_AJEC8|nr:conserved hypothetical protein [Histoplasma capsulatum var. duboisii H88]
MSGSDQWTTLTSQSNQIGVAENSAFASFVSATIAEGSFNKTFRLRMDNESVAIAKIPHPIAGPKYYTTASEVATMDFIPVPQVYAWNLHIDSAEYIIMEEAPGTKLEDVWDHLPLEDRIAIMKDLLLIENKLLSSREPIPNITAAPHIVAPTIRHTDLHSDNLLVDNGHITSAIDWQGAWAGPLFLERRHPRPIDHHGDVILKPPVNFKDLVPNEKSRLRRQITSSIVLYLYEQQTAKINPRLDRILRSKLGRIRCDPITFASNTWDDDLLPLRESLINLGFNFVCPIHFIEEELQAHTKYGKGWNDVQDFWRFVQVIVTRDGWTTHDDAATLFSELRDFGLRNMGRKDRKDFEAQTNSCIAHSDIRKNNVLFGPKGHGSLDGSGAIHPIILSQFILVDHRRLSETQLIV